MTHLPASGSTLALTPGQVTLWSDVGANTEPRRLPPSKITRRPVLATDTALARAGAGDYDAWLDHVWSAAGCVRPIRLIGEVVTVDRRTGEIIGGIPTAAMPDGVIYKACGNRRAAACPSCSQTYRRDAFHLIRAGLVGGKGVPAAVTSHPAVFATFTAPGFGLVHTRHVPRHTCADRRRCACRPAPCHARRDRAVCPHGRAVVCFARHERGDARLGQPLCADCYDHAAHVVWNNHAGELWRRTKQAIERRLNQLARQRGLPPVRVAHGKVAEFQARGAVHFHALLRLDGHLRADPEALRPPPPGLTVTDLADAVEYAAAVTAFHTAPHPAQPSGWRIAWGAQVDVRTITMSGASASDVMVAAYLAKYATKSTEVTGHLSRRLTAATVAHHADPTGTHAQRLIAAAWRLGSHPAFESLRRWAHMLGFGGHFLTKARRYSLTFAALRAARVHYRRAQTPGPEYAADRLGRQSDLDDMAVVVLGRLSYAGTGWHTLGDALLANTAADQARQRRQAGLEDLAHQAATPSDLQAA
ncbi:plasmid replication initiator protein [Actinomadura kijaniata]|uniref:Plasmid replication initiator protein n=1 Tax=Actinomadura namibiensis TaxID=182080 RepID=A0A7W3LPG5_ACTNM|nr:replication initiator [Actinomadura namibiensis]MBA8951886.1 hypothetical protein [Actinomadura namibiensis]